MEGKFEEIKQEILRRAHGAGACKEQYGRAYKAETMARLCRVIKDNWNWCCDNAVVTPDLLEKCRDEFAEQQIYVNVDTDNGFLLAWGYTTVEASGTATVRAWDNATVEALDNATVEAWDNATVRASHTATVRASGNATVRAWDNATVWASGNATVRASDNATVRASHNATVRASHTATVRASGNATVEAWGYVTVRASDNATVEAWGNAYCTSDSMIKCKLSGHALHKVCSTNTVYFASDDIKFVKQES